MGFAGNIWPGLLALAAVATTAGRQPWHNSRKKPTFSSSWPMTSATETSALTTAYEG